MIFEQGKRKLDPAHEYSSKQTINVLLFDNKNVWYLSEVPIP